MPEDASTPIAAGLTYSPAFRITSPWRKSSPSGRTLRPASRELRISTSSDPASVSSTRTTVSAPAGTGAPVMILTASPVFIDAGASLPAATSPMTRNVHGMRAMSLALTAYPSIDDARHGGMLARAATGSASTAPSADESGTHSTGIRSTDARICSDASAALTAPRLTCYSFVVRRQRRCDRVGRHRYRGRWCRPLVGENAEDEPFTIGVGYVAGERPDPVQGAGLRVYVVRRRCSDHAARDRAVDSGDRERVVECCEVGVCLHPIEYSDDRFRRNQIGACHSASVMQLVTIAWNSPCRELAAGDSDSAVSDTNARPFETERAHEDFAHLVLRWLEKVRKNLPQ